MLHFTIKMPLWVNLRLQSQLKSRQGIHYGCELECDTQKVLKLSWMGDTISSLFTTNNGEYRQYTSNLEAEHFVDVTIKKVNFN